MKTTATATAMAFALCATIASASVTITPASRTFAKEGSAGSILTSGSGTWSASVNVDWITLHNSSGDAGASCVYIVNANFTADTRTGVITIEGSTHTVTQTGYAASIAPTSCEVAQEGGIGSIAVTVDAGISWTAASNVDWISLDTLSGRGPGTVGYTIAPYSGVVSRSGSLTVASKTFMVTQTGTDVILTPAKSEQGSGANIVQFSVTALATTRWAVSTDASWISILDAGNGFGDSTIMLALASNPSSVTRTATVLVGTKTFEVVQAGNSAYALDILPKTATASPTGAFGNVAVLATPDMPWIAQSLTPWLIVSEGESGEGNGNVGYVVSANPTLEPRTAQMKVTARTPYPDIDIARGLKIWFGVDYGTARDAEVAGWTHGLWFRVTQSGTIHRLFGFKSGNAALYVNIDNKLVFQEGDQINVLDFGVSINTDYGLFLIYDGGTTKIYGGGKDSNSYAMLIEVTGELTLSTTGSTTLPSSGTLTYGNATSNYYWWNRPLSEQELTAHTSYSRHPPATSLYASVVSYTHLKTRLTNTGGLASGGAQGRDRHGLNQNAMTGDIFPSPIEYNASSYTATSSSWYTKSIGDSGGYYRWRLRPEKNISMNIWGKLATAATSSQILVQMSRAQDYSSNSSRIGQPSNYCIRNTPNGLSITEGTSTFGPYASDALTVGEWHMITLTYSYDKSRTLTLYVDGEEKGNHILGTDYPYFYPDQWRVIGGNGDVWFDEIETFNTCLTSAQVRELYDLEKPLEVIHTVTQGAISPSISTNEFSFPAGGGSGAVTATVAQNVAWTAAKDGADWVSYTSDTERTGSGTVAFDVGQNLSVTSRVARLTIAGLPVTIRQSGLASSVSYDGTYLGVDGGVGYVDVTTEGNAYWTATTDASWITIISGNEGLGDGAVMFVADPFTLTTQSRTAALLVADKVVYVTQRGYDLSIDPQVARIGSNSGAGTIGVAAPIDAVWEALIDSDWITIIGSRNGVGNGTLTYTVSANTSGKTRTGRIIISGKEYTITQTTTLPLVTETVGSGTVSGGGDYDQGAVASLAATPANGYVFSHWSGDMVGVTNEVNVTMDTAKNVTATFIPESAAEQLAAEKAAQGGFYTRDQIYAMELGNVLFDVNPATGRARIGVKLMETSDLAHPDWTPVSVTTKDLDIGADGSVGIHAPATGKAKFFKVISGE